MDRGLVQHYWLRKKDYDGTGQRKRRLVVDYRALNACAIPLCLRLPRLDGTMDDIGQSSPQYFTTLDLQSGFHQMELHPESRDKTGFLTHTSKYVYKRLPQGLRNSPIFFQSLMDTICKGVKFTKMMVYLDDLIIFSKNFKDHLQHLREVFTCLRNSGLKLKPSKCYFARRKIEFLGHVLSPEGISPDPKDFCSFNLSYS